MISPKSAFSKILRACAFPLSVLTTGRYWRTTLKLAGGTTLIFLALFALYCLVGGVVGWNHFARCWGEFTSGTDWVPDPGDCHYSEKPPVPASGKNVDSEKPPVPASGDSHCSGQNDDPEKSPVSDESVSADCSGRLYAAAFVVRLAGLVFFGGVFISAVTNLFLNVSEERTRGLFRYRREVFRNHFVIIGNGEETEALIRAIFNGKFGAYAGEYIVIMTHADVESARERLLSELASERKNRRGIVFYYGDLDSKECLRDLAPWNARAVFVLGDATDVSGRDVRNMSAMRLLDDIVAESILRCGRDARWRAKCVSLWKKWRAEQSAAEKMMKTVSGEEALKLKNSVAAAKKRFLAVHGVLGIRRDARWRAECVSLWKKWRAEQSAAGKMMKTVSKDEAQKLRNSVAAAEKRFFDVYGFYGIPVNVQICGVSTYSAIQKLDSFDRGVKGSVFEYIVPRVFNLYENWARRLWGFFGLRDGGAYRYRDLDYLPIRAADDPHHVHLVVVGLNQMGLALVLEALRICHYANFDENAGGPKTRVTVVDRDPSRELFFKASYPNLSQIYDVDVDFVCAEIESPEARRIIVESARDRDCLLTVAICFGSDDAALAAGLSLPEIVFEHAHEDYLVRRRLSLALGLEYREKSPHCGMKQEGNTVLIRQTTDRNEISRKLDLDEARYKYVRRFGYANSDFDSDLLDDELAKCVNALYEKWEVLSEGDETKIKRALADKEAAWRSLSEYKRWSNRFQVDSYRVYLNKLGYAAVEDKDGKPGTVPESLDAFRKYTAAFVEGNETIVAPSEEENFRLIVDMEHRRWVAERTLAGTRSYAVDFTPVDEDEEGKEKWAWASVQDKIYRRHNCICTTKELGGRQDRLEAQLKEKLSERNAAELRKIFEKKIAEEGVDASEAAEKLEKELDALEATRRKLAVRRLKRLEELDAIPVANMPALLKQKGYRFVNVKKE